MCTCAPGVVLAPLTSRHLPAPSARSGPVTGPGPLPLRIPAAAMTCCAADGQLVPLTWTFPRSTLLCGGPVATLVTPRLYQLSAKTLSLVLLVLLALVNAQT